MKGVVVIVGATCTGKSELAMALAEELPGEIINGDALQVYRGLDVGTAKPSREERRRVRHHLVDILDPSEAYSAGDFCRDARALLEPLWARGSTPLVVGGSGLYLQVFVEGIGPAPPSDEAVRRRVRQRLAQKGLEGLYEELKWKDPESASRVAAMDRQRIVRALEVWEMTGWSLTKWHLHRPGRGERLPALKIGLTLPREVLYHRIAHRVLKMVEAGWVDEVARLLEAGYDSRSPAFQAIGYRQLARHVQGVWSLDQAIGEITQATRRYARRQMTWFRRDGKICWITGGEGKGRLPEILDCVRSFFSRRSNDPT